MNTQKLEYRVVAQMDRRKVLVWVEGANSESPPTYTIGPMGASGRSSSLWCGGRSEVKSYL
jgi:hypothetical protein